ncbi:MAG: hypothetical protein GC181_02330 [Bacteroidetes bacterium]|nr:hypothetical protein [Bacteroidota bacterium]
MNLRKENDRKGLVGTVFIHIIIILLLLIWTMGDAKQMLDESDGSVQISFGDPLSGGTDAISESSSDANSQEQETPQDITEPTHSETQPDPTPTDATPTVTNDASETTVNATKKNTTTPQPTEQPKVNQQLVDALKKIGQGKKTGETDQNAGPGGNNKPGGDPNADNSGPGGQGKGGIGYNHTLKGFGVRGDAIQNDQQDFGSIQLKVYVNSSGRVEKVEYYGGTSASEHLIELSKRSVMSFKFIPNGTEKDLNVGIFTFNYAAQ